MLYIMLCITALSLCMLCHYVIACGIGVFTKVKVCFNKCELSSTRC